MGFNSAFNPLNAELNPIFHLLALLGAHHILHVSSIRVKGLIKYKSYSNKKPSLHSRTSNLLFYVTTLCTTSLTPFSYFKASVGKKIPFLSLFWSWVEGLLVLGYSLVCR